MTTPPPAGVRDQLHAQVGAALAEAARRGQIDDRIDGRVGGERTVLVGALVDEALRNHKLNALANGQPLFDRDEEDRLRRALLDTFLGLGDLQMWIDDDQVENIVCNGFDNVWVYYVGGKKERIAAVAASDEELADMLRRVAASSGAQERRFDLGRPRLDLRLSGGARLFATMGVTERVSVSIRRHRFMVLTLADLVQLGSITAPMRDLFAAMVSAHLNVIVSGPADVGKTTFIRALASEIDPIERIITIEDPYELALDTDRAHPDVVAMQPRESNVEGEGEIGMVELVRYATRMRPDRVIVGEVRGPEATALLNAFNQGTDGSFTSIHASSAAEAFTKLAAYARQSREQLPFDVTYQLIGGGVDVVIQLGKTRDGARVVTGVREVVGADGHQVRSNEIFRPGPDRRAILASRFSDSTLDRLLDAGFDPAVIGGW